MSDQLSPGMPDPSQLAWIFERIRQREGLTPARLMTTPRAAALLGLPAVRRHALGASNPAAAAVEIVAECVRMLLDATDQLVADTALGLGIYLAEYERAEIPAGVRRKLRNPTIGRRRDVLREKWDDLHAALGASAPERPSDRHLRGTVEPEVFYKVAQLLVSSLAPGPLSASHLPVPAPASDQTSSMPRKKVVIVGGVATDHVWHVEQIPELETSVMARRYARTPGGKGLSQAVAAIRLGLDVTLISAITNDHDAEEIEHRLVTAGLQTSALQRLPGRTSPQVGIFEKPRGESNAAVWRSTVELDVEHIENHARTIAGCDVLMVTFEIPKPVLYRTLDIARSAGERAPVIIATTGQPYPDSFISDDYLKQIDYLVSHLWELRQFSSPEARHEPRLLSHEVLAAGVKSLCILEIMAESSILVVPHARSRPR